jgi:hypothetical protein
MAVIPEHEVPDEALADAGRRSTGFQRMLHHVQQSHPNELADQLLSRRNEVTRLRAKTSRQEEQLRNQGEIIRALRSALEKTLPQAVS